MLSVFLIHIASLMSLPALSASQSITLAFSQSITWFSLQTWSVIADLLQILAALVFSSLVKIPVILYTSLRCDTIHFFTMFFYSCSQWPSCLSNVDTFTVFKVIDREADKAGRLIREAIWIRKTDNMDRDEGSYQLSWDKLLLTDDRHRKSVLMKASDVKSKRR